jgi:hypothetical protein
VAMGGRLAMLLICAAVPLAAQASVAGVVKDSSGRPIARADVAIEALGKHVLTDDAGRYLLSDIPPGARLVRARFLGYEASLATITLVALETARGAFILHQVAANLDTLIVKDRSNFIGVGLAGFEERRKLGFGKFIDSTELRQNEHERTYDLSTLSISSLAAVEIYRSSVEVPTEYGGVGSTCGVLLLWLRRD